MRPEPGMDLGSRRISYTAEDVILYHLAVGARADELSLVFERDLHVMPTFGVALGLWASDVLGDQGAWDISRSVHASQSLTVHAPLPPEGTLDMKGSVRAVWDKGSSAIFEIGVSCAFFDAVYSIYAPGSGGFGGERGPSASVVSAPAATSAIVVTTTDPTSAALYRLTGDRHLIHIDPVAAATIGASRPILHGLCTLAMAAGDIARWSGHSPTQISALHARFSGMVLPGETLESSVWHDDGMIHFQTSSPTAPVLTAGSISFTN